MKTAVTEQLGIDFPILAFSHCRDVVAEVSKAGGFGVLGAITFTPEELEVELQWIEKQIGDKPYGVDVLLPSKEGEIASGAKSVADLLPEAQVDFVLHLLAEHGIERRAKSFGAAPVSPARETFFGRGARPRSSRWRFAILSS